MTTLRRAICVFCGSSPGAQPAYAAAATELGRTIADRGQTLVYGGARVGLMGILADAALAAGGTVYGVIPTSLVKRELSHQSLTRLDEVASMHERKARMAELSDAFVVLPGGAGTVEEMAEIWTWSQLGLHTKPVGVLNVAGYWDRFFAFVDHAVAEAFLRPAHADMLVRSDRPAALLDALESYTAPVVEKWIGRDQT
jgi:uncharacterized protein (TIGR00730 family)